MMRIHYILIALLVLSACGDTEPEVTVTQPSKPGSVTEVQTVYEDGVFTNPAYKQLLEELDLCGPVDENCPRCAVCSPKFFRFFDIQPGGNIKNLFAIQVKALTILKGSEYSNPTREVHVYIRENGSLVTANRLKGYIMERITNKSGVDDLIVRFFRVVEDEDHFFNCLFQWSEKDKKYKYISVERIEGKSWGGDVKAAQKIETSQQVYNELVAEGFIQ